MAMDSSHNDSLPALGGSRRSFSLQLALRYLNPKRALFSIITLICLLGVSFGVMVLIVVLSVMGGLEAELKSRVLGLSPHIQVRYLNQSFEEPSVDWRELADEIEALPEVEHAGAFIEDYLLLNHLDRAAPLQFNGVDPEDKGRLVELEKLLEDGGQGSFDLGNDSRVVISDRIANEFNISLGDTIKVFSARNSEKALKRFEITRLPMLAERDKEAIDAIKADLQAETETIGGREVLPLELLQAVFDWVSVSLEGRLRGGESALLNDIDQQIMAYESVDGQPDKRSLEAGSIAKIQKALDDLSKLDKREEDFRVFEGLESIILPKELEVFGIYQSSNHVRIPDLFIPLSHAQELAGYKGGEVGAIAIRTTDAFVANLTKGKVEAILPEGWYSVTWMEQFGQWFELIERERWMMRFALGCIMLVSAFCIGAVMFTITMQKKREIGVMKALGAREGQMVGVFVYQGLLIGILGSALGVFLGWIVVIYRGPIQGAMARFGADPFPGEFHGFNKIPALMNPIEIGIIALCGVIMCTIAAWLPAFFAARADAAKSLRNF